jgi:hypothetical protein
MRRPLATLCITFVILIVLASSLCTALASSASVVSVRAYGAKGDGRTDDYAAIRAACAAAKRTGRTVYVPAGTYLMKSRLVMPAGVKIKGDGAQSWLKGPISVGSAGTCAHLKVGSSLSSTYVGGVSNVTFTSVEFVGGGGAFSGTYPFYNANVLTLGCKNTSNITFDGCTIGPNAGSGDPRSQRCDNVYVTMDPGAVVEDITFRDCHFMRSPRFQVEMWSGDYDPAFQDISFYDCVFEKSSCAALDYAGPRGSTVSGCTFRGSGAASTWPGDVIAEGGSRGLTVTGNTFYRGTGWSVACNAPGGNTITNNVFDMTVSPYDLTHTRNPLISLSIGSGSCDNNTVTGNTIDNHNNPSPVAIEVEGDNNKVTYNTLTAGTISVTGTGNIKSPNTISP